MNHDVEYSAGPGSDTNQAESFFSRVKRAEKGTHHKIAGKYLDWYAAELAWREDFRRMDNGWLTKDMLRRALLHPVSRWLKGYWQGNHPDKEFCGSRGRSADEGIGQAAVSYRRRRSRGYADLIVLPLLDAYRRYYGWRMAAYIFFVFFATMSLSALIMDVAFGALGWVPHAASKSSDASQHESHGGDHHGEP